MENKEILLQLAAEIRALKETILTSEEAKEKFNKIRDERLNDLQKKIENIINSLNN